MAFRGMLWQQKLLLGAFILAATAASQPDSSCNKTCGNLSIPYPFGTTEGCYLDSSFLITCNDTSAGTPTPFMRKGNIRVLNISLDGELRVLSFVARKCYNESGFIVNPTNSEFSLSKFRVSYTKNKFTAVGCATYGYISGEVDDGASEVKNYTSGCTSVCNKFDSVDSGSCSGIGCCQTSIPEGLRDFTPAIGSFKNHAEVYSFNPCDFGFLVEEKAYNFSRFDLKSLQDRETFPVVLDWAVGNDTCPDAQKNLTTYGCKAAHSECYNSTNGPGYRCKCSSGFLGNPYLPHGCLGN